MKLVAEVIQQDFCVALGKSQWKRLNKIDKFGNDRYEEVEKKLKAVNVCPQTIEYNGHFGSNIFFTLGTEYDVGAVMTVISEIVGK